MCIPLNTHHKIYHYEITYFVNAVHRISPLQL